MASHFRKYALILFAALLQISAFCQPNEYKPGDMIKESLQLFDGKGLPVTLKIPDGTYLIFYRYSWKDIGKGIETLDSVKLFEQKLAKILADEEINHFKVIMISYDRKADFAAWQELVSKNAPLKTNANYTVDYYNINGDSTARVRCTKLLSKITVFANDGKLLRWCSLISNFTFSIYGKGGLKNASIKAKLLSNVNGVKTPVENTVVMISGTNKKDTLSKSKTDMYGDFELHVPGNAGNYTIKVGEVSEKFDNIHIVTQAGKEISAMEKTEDGFQYHLLKADIVTLSEIHEEDITLKFETLKAANKKEFTIDENIFYEVGKSAVHLDSKPILDKVAKIMADNPDVTLMVISHSDAQGDDKSNLALSEKRALDVISFLVFNGIESKRVKGMGKGETEIRNRCTNGVNCSPKEHEYNRRTEFKFIRP